MEARQAERDLGRAGARGSRPPLRADDGDRRPVGRASPTAATPAPDDVVAQGETAAEKFLLRWRGEADPRHVKAIDTYWICTAEHGLNASTFTARVVASTGADCGAALSSAVGALSGPLHGGAPAYVKPMLEEVAAHGRRRALGARRARRRGKRIMGFGHRVYRAEDPRSRILKRTAQELGSPQVEVAEELEEVALAALQRAPPDRVLATNVEYYSAVVLDVAEIPPPLAPAMFACSRVAGWSAHILEQKRTGRLFRPSARYVGPARRALDVRRAVRLDASPRPPRRRTQLARARATSASSPTCGAQWDDELEAAARERRLPRARASPTARSAQFRFRQKLELLRRGLEDESPACRGSALVSLELLSRDHPGAVNAVRPLLHELANARRQRGRAAARDRLPRNGSPQRDTIVLLQGLAEDDEQDARAARGGGEGRRELLRKKAGAYALAAGARPT